jgi:hypothetical protein
VCVCVWEVCVCMSAHTYVHVWSVCVHMCEVISSFQRLQTVRTLSSFVNTNTHVQGAGILKRNTYDSHYFRRCT